MLLLLPSSLNWTTNSTKFKFWCLHPCRSAPDYRMSISLCSARVLNIPKDDLILFAPFYIFAVVVIGDLVLDGIQIFPFNTNLNGYFLATSTASGRAG